MVLLLGCAIVADAWHGVVPILRPEPTEIGFDGATLGVTATVDLTVHNDGGAPAEVSLSADGPFVLDRSIDSIPAGASIVVRVNYTATDYPDQTGTVHLVAGDSVAAVPVSASTNPDSDGDGQDAAAAGGADCDDQDASVYSGAPEVCYDGVSQDCDGSDDDCDDDGYALVEDCDDSNAAIHPAAVEGNNGVDDDCDGLIDETGFYAGMLVITEIAADFPAWIELCSAAPSVHLAGMTLHGVVLPDVVVPEAGCVGLCELADDGCAATITIELDEDTDTLELVAGALAVDTVAYTAAWPDASGQVRSLDSEQFDASRNDDASAWCLSASGSRGSPNPPCP